MYVPRLITVIRSDREYFFSNPGQTYQWHQIGRVCAKICLVSVQLRSTLVQYSHEKFI